MKKALITGSSSKLGAAIARHLATKGYSLGLHFHRNAEAGNSLASELSEGGCAAVALQADLTREVEVRALFGNWLSPTDSLDVLINNAGAYLDKPLLECTEREWQDGLQSTATATFLTSRRALPHLRRSGHGRIINIGDSSCERIGSRNLAPGYHIGKTGVLMLTKSFAASEASHGLTVNMISPGYLENSVGLPDRSKIPAGRFGQFSDICTALDFLISPEASYCSGSNLILSGGWNLR